MSSYYKGKILIAAPDTTGDVFARSVVVVIEHNERGAFGLVLNKQNREVGYKLRKIFGHDIEIYEGGPVQHDQIFFIIKGEKITESYTPIDSDFYVTEDLEKVVEKVVENKISLDNVKIFSGYAGWSPQQLEYEVNNKMWTVLDAEDMEYTASNDQQLWKDIMQTLGGKYLLWVNTPADVHQN